jgi:SAM-dependent methyltransferase
MPPVTRRQGRRLLRRLNRPGLSATARLAGELEGLRAAVGELERRLEEGDRELGRRLRDVEEFAGRLAHLMTELQERLGRTNELLFSLPDPSWRDHLYRQSKERWAGDEPDLDLTWGGDLSGAPFVERLAAHRLLDREPDVLEIGPGWGRLLLALREADVKLGSYTGLELSVARVSRLTARLGGARTRFVAGDVDELEEEARYDLCISSLTFKHLFPSFERAAERIHRALRPGGVLAVDLVEGQMQEFQHNWKETFIRAYTRSEAEQILRRAGYSAVEFDLVTHRPGYERLLAIGRA